jgi:hypothetical protein
MGVGSQRHAQTDLPPVKTLTHCIRCWVGSRDGLDRCGKSRPHRDSIPDHPARSELQYRLRYLGPPGDGIKK